MKPKNIRSDQIWLCAVLLAVSIGAFLLLAFPREARAVEEGQLLQVTRLELAYRPGGDLLKARFTLASGMAVEWIPSDDADRDTLFRMADLFARFPSRMSVTLMEGAVTGMQVAIP